MKFELPNLPYDIEALAPHLSAETLEVHHGKHHAGYVKKLNELVDNAPYAGNSLEEIIRKTSSHSLFNNAAQHWNHSFYWKCMSPHGGRPSATLAETLTKSFRSVDSFKTQFIRAGVEHFGSGWAWLVLGRDGIRIATTADADLPLAYGKTALLTCDLWEHAYYIDFRNERGKYLDDFWKIVNWDFVNSNYERSVTELGLSTGAENRAAP